MNLRKYKDRQVMVERIWDYGGDQYVDLKDVQNGEGFQGIRVDELDKPKGVAVTFEKGDEVIELIKGSIDYKHFLQENELKEMFVENCLKGVTKTHKGFTIHYK